MEEKLIKTVQLKNNIKIDIYDESKKLAGDRWLVTLLARMDIPVDDALFINEQQPDQNIDDIKSVIGDRIVFEQKRERIFIDEQEKDALLSTMMDQFEANTLPYMSRPDFPGKYILKKYKDETKSVKY